MKNGRLAGLLVDDKWTQDSGIGCLSFIGLDFFLSVRFLLIAWMMVLIVLVIFKRLFVFRLVLQLGS